MTESTVETRVAKLQRKEFQDKSFFLETYGILDQEFDETSTNIDRWARRANAIFRKGHDHSRWVFESYCQSFGLVPRLQASARLGMTTKSFDRTVAWAAGIGVSPHLVTTSGGLFSEGFVASIHEQFPKLRTTIFSDQTQYSRLIHQALRDEGVEIEEAQDPTASKICARDIDLSYYVDIVTLEPIGIRFNVWLTFGKPMSLEPDQISALTYARNEDALKPYLAPYARVDSELIKRLRGK